MAILNIEFKARANEIEKLESLLHALHPQFVGEDNQTDTYFHTPVGRLKLREGNIENALIHYDRKNIQGLKQSDILLYKHQPDQNLKEILINALGIKAVVKKRRKIYFHRNVKIHLDQVEGLGQFVEVEAIDNKGERSIGELTEQCQFFARLFSIQRADYIDRSYSDMLLEIKG